MIWGYTVGLNSGLGVHRWFKFWFGGAQVGYARGFESYLGVR